MYQFWEYILQLIGLIWEIPQRPVRGAMKFCIYILSIVAILSYHPNIYVQMTLNCICLSATRYLSHYYSKSTWQFQMYRQGLSQID